MQVTKAREVGLNAQNIWHHSFLHAVVLCSANKIVMNLKEQVLLHAKFRRGLFCILVFLWRHVSEFL